MPAAGRLTSAAVLVVGVLLGTAVEVARRSRPLAPTPAYGEVIQALGERRLFEPRLTGHSAYERCRSGSVAGSPARACSALPIPDHQDFKRLVRASGRVRRQARLESSTAARHASCLSQLIWATDSEQLDKVVRAFETLSRMDSDSAEIQSDLAAVYLVRALDQASSADLYRSANAALRATEKDPGLPAAWFNLGLALRRTTFVAESRRAFEAYLERDWTGPWAEEVRGYLQDTPVTRRDPSSQVILQTALHGLGDWAEQEFSGGRPKAGFELARVRSLGRELARRARDHSVLDIASSIDRISARRREEDVSQLLTAHLAFKEGLRSYEHGRFEAASTSFRAAVEAARQNSEALALWASFYLASSEYQQARDDYGQALDLLRWITKQTQSGRYPILRARTSYMEGLISAIRGRYSEAIVLAREARNLFEQSRAWDGVERAESLIGAAYRDLGNENAAWHHAHRSLRGRHHQDGPRHLALLSAASLTALTFDAPRIALLIQEELVRLAESREDPLFEATALRRRADILRKLGDHSLALRDLRRSLESVEQIGETSIRRQLLADIHLVEAQLLLERAPNQAIKRFDSVIATFETSGYQRALVGAYVGRARAHFASASTELAALDLERAISELERQRQVIPDPGERIQYFDLARSVFDEAIAVAVRRGDGRAAFMYAERGRARSILDSLLPKRSADSSRTAAVSQIRMPTSLGRDITLLAYWSLSDRVVIWVAQGERVHLRESSVPRGELEGLVEEFREAVFAGQSLPNRAGQRLAELLIQPVAPILRRGTYLVVIPDHALHRLPFSALPGVSGNPFLISDFAIAFAPSSTVFLSARQLLTSRSAEAWARSLVVGAPLVDMELFDLPPLRGVQSEVTTIASLLENPVVLLGTTATRETFLAQAADYQLVHFAGHAVPNTASPHLSRLFLTPDPSSGDSGQLALYELASLPFDQAELVVLSACSTSRGYRSVSEGVSNFATALLAAGVPAVVTNMTDIDDQIAADFTVAFYRKLMAGADPARALQLAAVQTVRNSESPSTSARTWAGFQLHGAFLRQEGYP